MPSQRLLHAYPNTLDVEAATHGENRAVIQPFKLDDVKATLEEKMKDFYQHNLTALIRLAGLEQAIKREMASDKDLEIYVGVVKDWSEQTRYNRNGKDAKRKAEDIVRAVSDPDHGMLQCLQKYW